MPLLAELTSPNASQEIVAFQGEDLFTFQGGAVKMAKKKKNGSSESKAASLLSVKLRVEHDMSFPRPSGKQREHEQCGMSVEDKARFVPSISKKHDGTVSLEQCGQHWRMVNKSRIVPMHLQAARTSVSNVVNMSNECRTQESIRSLHLEATRTVSLEQILRQW